METASLSIHALFERAKVMCGLKIKEEGDKRLIDKRHFTVNKVTAEHVRNVFYHGCAMSTTEEEKYVTPIVDAIDKEKKRVRKSIKNYVTELFIDHAQTRNLLVDQSQKTTIVTDFQNILDAYANDDSQNMFNDIFYIAIGAFDKDDGWQTGISNKVMQDHGIDGFLPDDESNLTKYYNKYCRRVNSVDMLVADKRKSLVDALNKVGAAHGRELKFTMDEEMLAKLKEKVKYPRRKKGDVNICGKQITDGSLVEKYAPSKARQ